MAEIPTIQDTAQDCYTMAYFVLPPYVFGDTKSFVGNLSRSSSGARVYYVMASFRNRREPRTELSFPVHLGNLDADTHYCIIEYPTPPVVDLSDLSLEEMFTQAGKVVQAPYFSAIVQDQNGPTRYFILGQSPDGFTTLRSVTLNSNANWGPGCEPEVQAFVELLREHLV